MHPTSRCQSNYLTVFILKKQSSEQRWSRSPANNTEKKPGEKGRDSSGAVAAILMRRSICEQRDGNIPRYNLILIRRREKGGRDHRYSVLSLFLPESIEEITGNKFLPLGKGKGKKKGGRKKDFFL